MAPLVNVEAQDLLSVAWPPVVVVLGVLIALSVLRSFLG